MNWFIHSLYIILCNKIYIWILYVLKFYISWPLPLHEQVSAVSSFLSRWTCWGLTCSQGAGSRKAHIVSEPVLAASNVYTPIRQVGLTFLLARYAGQFYGFVVVGNKIIKNSQLIECRETSRHMNSGKMLDRLSSVTMPQLKTSMLSPLSVNWAPSPQR